MVSTPSGQVLALLDASPVRLGKGSLICIDGLSAAGKTTLSRELQAELVSRHRPVRLLHTDAMLQGWNCLPELTVTLANLTNALAEDRAYRWYEFDWQRNESVSRRRELPLAHDEVLILEGVGAAAGPQRRYAAVQVWCELCITEQSGRWRQRGDDLTRLARWQTDEQELHARWQTRSHADLEFTF